MRILYMAPDIVPFPKGSGTRIEATVRALSELGAEVTLVTPRLDDRRLAGIDHHPVEVLGHGSPVARMLSFRDACTPWIERGGWDLAWFRSPWEGVPAVLRRLPCVFEAHGFPSVEMPSHDPAVRADADLLDNLVAEENLVLRGAARLVTPSRTGRSYLMSRGVDPERIHVVPNALATEFGQPAGFSGDRLRLLYVGTLAPWQGVGHLFEALAYLRGIDVELTLIGTRKGVWVRDLRERAAALRVRGRVRLLGPQPREALPALLAQADVCVAPLLDDPRNSVQGCCPIKIVDYMAAGRPILSTRIRPVEEMLTHGDTAWLVEPSSPYALACGLRWLAQHRDEALALGRRAQEEARRHWTLDHFKAGNSGPLDSIRISRERDVGARAAGVEGAPGHLHED